MKAYLRKGHLYSKDLEEKLLNLDVELHESNPTFERRIKCFIVGSASLILNHRIVRGTSDIDIYSFEANIAESLLEKYNMNRRVASFADSIPYYYEDRVEPLVKINEQTLIIDYYALSLEDLIIMKIIARRPDDEVDFSTPGFFEGVNWELLDQISNEMLKSMMNSFRYRDFRLAYEDFLERWKP